MLPIPLDYETPGDKPSQADLAIVCPACGKDGAVRGRLAAADVRYFYPYGVKGSLLMNPRVEAHSYACVACGVVTIVVDPDELRRTIGVGDEGADKPSGTDQGSHV